MSDVTILAEEESYRLIRSPDGRCAVIECRGGRVYSLHARERREAPDTPAGMLAVVGEDGWRSEGRARRRFDSMVRAERRFAQKIW